MPPLRKPETDKAAWAWTEGVDLNKISLDNVKTAYKLFIPKCQFGICRRNCRGNPYCLSGLGEGKWLLDVTEEVEEDDELDLRPDNSFVGLRNLGATCYINSLLQLWFHNIDFRNAILRWDPKEEQRESAFTDGTSLEAPVTVIGHLQYLFALMQFGKKKSVDPTDFIKSLDIEPSTQQDAHEFLQLFVCFLEDYLSKQSNSEVRDVVSNNFQGECHYLIRCSECNRISETTSKFFEMALNVKGNKTLDDCITEFLNEEKLEGSNMYWCELCKEKRVASRFVRLSKLPPVLNLQLMRFIYDREKGQKKKLNTPIQFPEQLDLGKYLGTEDGTAKCLYKLTAVLKHEGPSAYSGHYVANICDQATGSWYKFNDESVMKAEGKKTKLLADEDYEVEAAKKTKQVRPSKGFISSSNAYMLVYSLEKETLSKPISEEELQPHLKHRIAAYNENIFSIVEDAKAFRRSQKLVDNIAKAEMASFLPTLPVKEKWEVVPVKWLINWIAIGKPELFPIDNSPLLCPHAKIDPNKTSEMKFIDSAAAEHLFTKFKGGPRLNEDSLCFTCVKEKCHQIKTRQKITEDQKTLNQILKFKEERDSFGFWVGKNSLKTWRKKAMALNSIKEGINDENNHNDTFIPGRSSNGIDSKKVILYERIDYDQCSTILFDQDFEDYKEEDEHFVNKYKRKLNSSDPNKKFSEFSKTVKSMLESLLSMDSCDFMALSEPLKEEINLNLSLAMNCWMKLYSRKKDECFVTYSTDEANSAEAHSAGGNSDSDNEAAVPPAKRVRMMNSETDTAVSGGSSDEAGQTAIAFTEATDRGQEDKGNAPVDHRSDDEEDDAREFNEDIICSHGNLSIEESSRRLVPDLAWAILKCYFPESREFLSSSEPCTMCLKLSSKEQEVKDQYKERASREKALLPTLFSNKGWAFSGPCYLISSVHFLEPWRRFIREAGRREPPAGVQCSSLLCKHGLLLYNPLLPTDISMFYPVSEEEWKAMTTLYPADHEITAVVENSMILTPEPGVCSECVSERLLEEQRARLNYSKAELRIRQIFPEEKADAPLPSTVGAALLDNQNKEKCKTPEPIRRSSRRKRQKNEMVVSISSTETLMDLKVKLLNMIQVAPYDQHLYLEDKEEPGRPCDQELNDHGATLASLSIFPDSLIYLKVDVPDELSSSVDDMRRTEPERGFQGTGLLKR